MFAESFRVSTREELTVDFLELLLSQVTRWTVLVETLVPLFDFFFAEMCVLLQEPTILFRQFWSAPIAVSHVSADICDFYKWDISWELSVHILGITKKTCKKNIKYRLIEYFGFYKFDQEISIRPNHINKIIKIIIFSATASASHRLFKNHL